MQNPREGQLNSKEGTVFLKKGTKTCDEKGMI